MKRKDLITAIAALIASAIMLSCGQNRRSEAAFASDDALIGEADVEMKLAESSNEQLVTSMAAIASDDTTRKFVRTAKLKFRVKDVLASTYDVENIAVSQGGFVLSSRIDNRIDRVTTTNVSRDSAVETTYYRLECSIALRVPAANLDRTLRDISRNIEQLEYRDIQATDVTLNIQSNSLARKRELRSAERAEQAISRARNSSGAGSSTSPEELARSSEERADAAMLNNLQLADQIAYASITVSIFQRDLLKRETLPREQSLGSYRPNLGARIADAFRDGWMMAEVLLLLIVKLWALIAMVAVGYLIWRYTRKRSGKEDRRE
ncbi:MAG: DUF4349 domain-containing protein [Tannerellaceae bacterium]|jgi:hypothetical protein|nr:DUF4349 domain-containing protein [Tannerellaceae bacterium]